MKAASRNRHMGGPWRSTSARGGHDVCPRREEAVAEPHQRGLHVGDSAR